MKRLTVVIQYEKGQEQPSFHADMDCLGGKITAVLFDDGLTRLEEAEDQLSALTEQHAN